MLKIIILSVLFFSQHSIASYKDEERLEQEYAQRYPGKTRPTPWTQYFPVFPSYYQPCTMERIDFSNFPEKKILTKSELIEHIVSDRKVDRMMGEDRWHVESIEELAALELLSLEQIIAKEEAIQAKKLRILDRIVGRILDNIK